MGNFSLDKTDATGEVISTTELDIRIYPIAEPKGNTKAYASIGIDGMFGVHGISVVEGKNGLFVAMPQTKDKNGEYRDIFHPVTSDGRKEINKAVLAEYAVQKEKVSVKEQIKDGAKADKEAPAKDAPAPGKGKGAKSKPGPEH